MSKIGEKLKGFLKMTGPYAKSAAYLAEHGYNDEYIKMLSEEMQNTSKTKDIAEGQALMAQAFMFRGELEKAVNAYDAVGIEALPGYLKAVFVNNYLLCLFLLDRNKKIKEIYREYNHIALAENTLVMRRSIAINECASKRYENAITVLVKLLDEPDPRVTLMADICIVKAMLALDMRDRAKEIAQLGFDRYKAMGDITNIVNKLKMEIDRPVKSKKRK